jgi:hypothetical protein
MRNKRKLVIALSLILCLTASVGFTMAYFTDYENAKGGAVVKLSGQTEVKEEFDGNNKKVTIKNTGDTDMVVRLRVFGDEDHMTVNSTGNTDWLEGTDGFWYYKKVLPAGAEASMFKVDVSGKIDPGDPIDFEITVVHESQRVTYDGDKVAVPEGWKIDSISAE